MVPGNREICRAGTNVGTTGLTGIDTGVGYFGKMIPEWSARVTIAVANLMGYLPATFFAWIKPS